MTKQKRITRIETCLTPKQAVILWLKQEHQGQTSQNYARLLINRPPSALPRSRVGKQVIEAIRLAMKGQDPDRIHRAVRQGHMHADLLILLVNRTNWLILDDSQVRWLKIALLHERIRNAALLGSEDSAVTEWVGDVRAFATELFSLQAASVIIQNKFFDGECILLADAIDELGQQTKWVQGMMDAFHQVATETGHEELANNCVEFRKTIEARASRTADYIVSLARSKMLEDFGEHEAADAVIRPYFLEGLSPSGTGIPVG